MKNYLILGLFLMAQTQMTAMDATNGPDSGRDQSPVMVEEQLALTKIENFSVLLEAAFDRITGLQERVAFLQNELAVVNKRESSFMDILESLLLRVKDLESAH